MRTLPVLGAALAALTLGAGPALAADQPSASPAAGAAFDPYQQTIEWADCVKDAPGGDRCAMVTVPIDYADPSVGTTTLALRMRPATGSKVGTLFLNPGGPGGSGLDFQPAFLLFAPEALTDAYDIVGFDPRGVGSSDPLGCLDTAGMDELLATDADPDDPASVARYADLVRRQGEACLRTNPQLAQHVTTVETAKDLDVLRALVGDEQLHYYGASYGTFLGATYAALFPDKVGRLVLDGAMDPSLSAEETALRQVVGIERAFDDWLADCLATDCPLGTSTEEVEGKVAGLLESLADQPMASGDPERPLTQALAFYGIVEQLYSQSQWPFLTQILAAALSGDGSGLLAGADMYNQRGPDGYANNQQQANTAINCLDASLKPPPASPPTEADFLAASSLFGEIAYGYVAVGCTSWPIKPSVTEPDYSAPGAAPILVVGTTRDPATPFESAQKLADLLDSGVLLIRDGEGHTAYHQGNACIDDAITAYLVEGTVPADGTECAAPVASPAGSPAPS
jgi:pimeloyl-ACP methyl ester carboxylesterase